MAKAAAKKRKSLVSGTDKLAGFSMPGEKEYVHIGVFLGAVRKFLRDNYGDDYTQSAVARYLGLASAQYISNFERGLHLPSSKAAAKLMEYYGVPSRVMYNLFLSFREREYREQFIEKRG